MLTKCYFVSHVSLFYNKIIAVLLYFLSNIFLFKKHNFPISSLGKKNERIKKLYVPSLHCPEQSFQVLKGIPELILSSIPLLISLFSTSNLFI